MTKFQLDDPATRRAEVIDHRPAQGPFLQMVLAEALVEEWILHDAPGPPEDTP